MIARLAALLALAWLAAACAPQAGPVDDAAPAVAPAPLSARDGAILFGTDWEAIELDGHPVQPGSRLSLMFEADRVGGYGGCNWFGAHWRNAGGGMRIGAPTSTARGCVDPVLAQETALFAALSRVVAFELADARLRLLDADGRAVLVYVPRLVAAMDPAALPRTRWRLVAAEAASQARPITLEFVDGTTLRGFGGCRGYTGTYRAAGDRITVPSLAMDSTSCALPRAAHDGESAFVGALSEATYWLLEGDRLRLRTVDGKVVEFARMR